MKRLLALFIIGFMTTACQPEAPQPVTNNGTMTCSINGTSWSAVQFNNSLELNVTDGVTSAKGLKLMGKNSSQQQLTLGMATYDNPDVENMPLGAYLSTSETFFAYAEYWPNGINSGESTGGGSNDGNVEITIGAFNSASNTCSGTFSFVIQDYQTGDTLYTVTNGQFSSVSYTLI